jgi:hypothetical protein
VTGRVARPKGPAHVRILAVILVVLSIAVSAQQPRDATVASAARGSASIRGVVVSADAQAAPIRRAIVTISGEAMPGQSAVTDDGGRFVFGGLAAGTFTVSAAKAAYLPGSHGARRPGQAGSPIALGEGQRVDVRIPLARGGVLGGVVRDPRGNPRPGVQVGALDLRVAGAIETIYSSATYTTTDDRGAYRIFGLAPGEYAIVATPRTNSLGSIGRRSAADMDALLLRLRQSTRAGSTAAQGSPAASIRVPASPAYAHVPTYYPGAAQIRDATRVTIAAGDERMGLDFVVAPLRTVTIEGVVQGPAANLSAVQLTLIIRGPQVPQELGTTPSLVRRPDATGRFRYASVMPGFYRIIARGTLGPADPAATTSGGRGAGTAIAGGAVGRASAGADDALYGVADVEVSESDVSGVVLTLEPGSVLSGRVAFDGAPPAVDLTKILLRVAPPTGRGFVDTDGTTFIGNRFGALPPTPVRPDGTFAVPGIAPGAYGLFVILPTEMSPAWWLRSAVVGGRDLLDAGFEVDAGTDLSGAVLTFSTRRAAISGTVITPSGAPASEYFVIVMPANRAHWRPHARRVKTTRPSTDGAFAIRDLPGGDYLIAALTDVTPADLNDARFLERVAASGAPLALADGESKRQDLRIGGAQYVGRDFRPGLDWR